MLCRVIFPMKLELIKLISYDLIPWCLKISRALHIQPKIPKMSKRGQMAQKCPGKISRKSGNCWILEKPTIQPEIPGAKSNGTETPGRKFPKISVYLARLSSFR